MLFLSAREILDERSVCYANPDAITTINSGVIVCSGGGGFFRGAGLWALFKDFIILTTRHSCPPSSGHNDFYVFCGAWAAVIHFSVSAFHAALGDGSAPDSVDSPAAGFLGTRGLFTSPCSACNPKVLLRCARERSRNWGRKSSGLTRAPAARPLNSSTALLAPSHSLPPRFFAPISSLS